MKKLISVILCGALCFTLVSGCKNKTEETVSEKEEPVHQEETYVYLGALKPVSEAKVIPAGKGQIKDCPYETGDSVTAGTLLYTIDDNGLSDTIATTKNAIAKSDISIAAAQENVDNLKIYSPASGILHNFGIKTGERVNASKIGDIYNENNVVAIVPFTETQKNQISVGDSATVTSAELMAGAEGKVTRIYDAKADSVQGSVLYNAEITVYGAGGFYNGLSVSAKIKNENGTFTSPVSGIIQSAEAVSLVSKGSGTAKNVYVKDGQKVSAGQLIAELENTSVVSALERARLDRNDLNIKLARLEKNYSDLFVYAPAGGTITSKSKKTLDNITSNSESIMTISNISTLIMTVNVSETVLGKISEGMSVPLELANEEISSVNGVIHSIVREGSISGGSKTYPVTIHVTNDCGISAGAAASVDFGGAVQ